MPKDAPEKIVAVNTDEGEPGTFKDREIVERDPHQVIEGVVIAAYAIGATRAYDYIRGEFFLGVKRWIKAIADAYEHGFLEKIFSVPVLISTFRCIETQARILARLHFALNETGFLFLGKAEILLTHTN